MGAREGWGGRGGGGGEPTDNILGNSQGAVKGAPHLRG